MNVPPGRHTLKAYLANNDHSDLIPPVERQVEFTIITSATRNSAPGNPLAHRLPRTAEPDGLLSSDLVIIVLLVISMAILIGGLTTQSYSQVDAASGNSTQPWEASPVAGSILPKAIAGRHVASWKP